MEYNESEHLATTFRWMAVIFWENAKTLDKEIERNEKGMPTKYTAIPYYYLISHATELMLKTALLKRGVTKGQLRKFEYGHNLKNLLKGLLELDLKISQSTQEIIIGLNGQHKDHSLRYEVLFNDDKQTFTPPSELLNGMLDELLSLTRIATQGK